MLKAKFKSNVIGMKTPPGNATTNQLRKNVFDDPTKVKASKLVAI